jgi:hypothetical protein
MVRADASEQILDRRGVLPQLLRPKDKAVRDVVTLETIAYWASARMVRSFVHDPMPAIGCRVPYGQ